MSLGAVAGYAAKVGSPKVASWVAEAVQRRGWARRAARKAFRKVERPRPARAMAQWIKRPDTLTEVWSSPDKPGSAAVVSLDDHLCGASKRWQRLARVERERRLDTVLGAVYDTVLTEHDPRWTTRIASERILESSRRTANEVAEFRQEVRTAREVGSENEVVERLALVPAYHRDAALRRWRDAKDDTWRVLAAVTSTETNPQAVVSQWQSVPPEWLSGCAVPARLVAADMAWAYGASQLAARLYLSAARDGAPRAQHWAGRAVLILVDTDPDAAMAATDEFANLPADPLFQAAAAVVRQDWPRLRETLAVWSPDDPLERTLRFMLFQREALMGRGREVIDRAVLNEVIAAGMKELTAAHLPGVAMIVARLVVLRAQRGEADHPYKDLRVAGELAVRVRDGRRAVRAPSAEAVAVAVEAALAAGDLALVITLGDATDGQALEQEARDPAVHEKVVLARALRGEDVGPIRPADATSAFAAARLRAAVSERRGTDPVPALQEALTASTDDYERITALAGLARAGAVELPGLEEITLEYPDQGREIRALADLAQGREDQAISSLRSLASTSLTAAMTLANAYRQAGDLAAEVDTLRTAARDFHDPQLRLAAATALVRGGDRASARIEVRELLAAAPADWPDLADAQRLGAQLALDDGDLLAGGDLLLAALATDPDDAATRWALVRVLLARSDYPAAWRAYQDHPTLLEPITAEDALAWIEVHREYASGQDTVRGCLRIMRQFADSEAIRAAAIGAVIGPGTSQDALPDELLDEFHTAMAEFTDQWPDSRRLVSVPVPEDPAELLTKMSEFVCTTPEQQQARRELTSKIVGGELPLGVLAAAVSRTYAEVILIRGVDVIPARHPDPAEHAACIQAAREALDTDVVIDTTALVVTRLLGADHQGRAHGAFRLLTVDNILADARAARQMLNANTRAHLVWDDLAQTPRLIEADERATAALAAAAAALVTDIERVRRLPPATPQDPRAHDAFFSPWFPLIDLARSQHATLWSDDTALRTLARAEGVPAFSTPAVLQLLVENGTLSGQQRHEIDRLLLRERVGDLPLLTHPDLLMEAAEDESWQPGSVAIALGRPAAWTDPRHTTDVITPLLRAVTANAPRSLPAWTYWLVRGVAYAHKNTPTTAHLAIAPLLAVIGYISGAQGPAAATMVTACRQALHDTGYTTSGAQDPVVTAARLMYRAISRILPHQTAAQYMTGFTASLNDADRDAIIRIILTDGEALQ